MWTCRRLLLAAILVCAPLLASADEPPTLTKARALYNAGDYEAAIETAMLVKRYEQWTDAATLVIARSHLERYRQSAQPTELAEARAALREVQALALLPRDRIDLLIGLGQALYLDEIFGAAAELFDTALSHAWLLSEKDRLLLLDWWATALDRDAQLRPAERRLPVYARIGERMDEELRIAPGNPPANYWLAVAARGVGDIERAWSAAVAAWIRSSLTPESAEGLREDLDRLVVQALIPERVRLRAPVDQGKARAALLVEWEALKEQWK